MNIHIEKEGVIIKRPDFPSCMCGKCDNYILIIRFDNGDEWPIRNVEFFAIKQAIKAVHEHNMSADHYCYTAKQEVPVSEVL